jgi:hypothetical protein
VAVIFIGVGNRCTRRKPPTCRKSMTNLSHNVVSSTLLHERGSNSQLQHKSNCYTITTTTVSITKQYKGNAYQQWRKLRLSARVGNCEKGTFSTECSVPLLLLKAVILYITTFSRSCKVAYVCHSVLPSHFLDCKWTKCYDIV